MKEKLKYFAILPLIFGMSACVPTDSEMGLTYDNIYQNQYPIATDSGYRYDTSQPQERVIYGGGSVMVYPIDAVSDYGSYPTEQTYGNSYDSNYSNNYDANYSQGTEIYFKHGSSRLGSIDKNRIEELANMLKITNSTAKVVGYASDDVFTTNDILQQNIINLRMSAKRATKVTEQLYKKGVSPERLETISVGSAYSTGDDKKDRRVDIIVE